MLSLCRFGHQKGISVADKRNQSGSLIQDGFTNGTVDTNTRFYAQAPTRIDLAGGWTDLIPFAMETDGFVLNAAIDLYASATLTPVSYTHL